MILDTLDHAQDYGGLHPRLARGLEFLRATDLMRLPTGRHEIDGDRIFAIVDEYTTRPRTQCRLEAHRRYHDIQYMVRGIECIGHAPLRNMTEQTPYDPARDIAFFEGDFDILTLRAGMFAIFGPEDAHAPQIAAGAPSHVRKVVVKLALNDR
jgi:biofilm protein TabA